MNGSIHVMTGHTTPATTQVLILGAGVLGMASAYFLAREGLSVTLVDRGRAGGGSTWAGAGILSPLLPWDYPEDVTRLTERGRQMWPGWSGELMAGTGVDPEYRVSGMWVASPGDQSLYRSWCQTHGWTWSPAVCPPGLDVPQASQGLWLPDVAQVRNPRLVRVLIQQLEQLGVTLLTGVEDVRLQTDQDRVTGLRMGDRQITCDQMVVAAGAWTVPVLGSHAGALPVKPVRGQMLLFKCEPGRLPCILYQAGKYLVPRVDGHILAGSTLEDVGYDTGTTREALSELRDFAWSLLPWLRGQQPLGHWAGLRPGSPGNRPIVARHPALKNLYLNTGHFRYGLTMAPASGLDLSRMLMQDRKGVDQYTKLDISSP